MTDPERLSEQDLAWLEQLDRELTAEIEARCPSGPPPVLPPAPPAPRWTTWLLSFALLVVVCGALAVAASTSSVLWTTVTILLMPAVVLPFLWEDHRRGR